MTKASEATKRWRDDFRQRDPDGYKKYRADEQRKRYRKGPGERDASWRRSLQRLYGLTEQTWYTIFEAQGGVCALCGQPPIDGERLCVDHNHETGKVRALVHRTPCNIIIGYVEKYSELCRLATPYLDTHPC